MPKKREFTSNDRALLIKQAMTWLQVPYVLGGQDRNGIGCSNFVSKVFLETLGIRLIPWTDWLFLNLDVVPLENLQPADVVFFCKEPRPTRRLVTHVGLYVGDGQIIHSSSPPRQVSIQQIDDLGSTLRDSRERDLVELWLSEVCAP